MRNDDFIGKNFYWFTGEVEDIKDPRKMGRVRVRCHGYHGGHPSQSSANFNGVTSADLYTADLPWATVMMPSTSQSLKGFGRTHELEVGSWVVGFFRDGMSAQDPLILGSISTMTDGTIDMPSEAQLENPTNKVYKSQSGHLVEFDNTDGSERIHIRHINGTSATLEENNNLTISVAEGGNLTITVLEGNTTITTGGDTNIESTGDTFITSTGRSRIQSGKEVTIQAVEQVRIE